MKKTPLTILAAAVLCFGSSCMAIAQDAPVAQADQITEGGEIIQDDDTGSGKFEPVEVDALATSDVALQFQASLTNKTVTIEASDGGALSSNLSTIDTSGSLNFSFQVSDQPGVHRVFVIDPNAGEDDPHIIGVVQFEVPSPTE